MRPRSFARRLAFQYLFMHDLSHGVCEEARAFLEKNEEKDETIAFASELIDQALESREEIDVTLRAAADNYALERIAAVERNIIRLGISELRHKETPPRVVIDEAVELAKNFGGKDSGGFVNGILDRVARELARDAQ